jgi:sugar O-acyltransferase (sialic acid O-acetyltransferase NeuD family)
MKNIIIIGNGGHASSCKEIIINTKKYKITHYFTLNKKELTKKILFYNKKNLIKVYNKTKYAHIGIGQILNKNLREKIFKELVSLGFILPCLISKKSYFSKTATIDSGSIVMNNAVVNANVSLGKNVIINTSAVIEHDVIIKNDVHVATGAIINGGVKIGSNSFIGSGVIIKQGLSIPKNSFIQAGSIILKNKDIR